MTKVFIETLGCKVNQYESQAMRELLEKNGIEPVDALGEADIYLINTCVVTGTAEKDSLSKIAGAKRKKPGIKVLVTGCLADLEKEIKGADFTLKNEDKAKVLEKITGKKFVPDKNKIKIQIEK